MAKFSLTAQIGLQAPSNTKQVVSQIQNALKGVSVNVNINANTRQLSQVSNQLNSVNQSAKAANTSVSELGKTIGAAARRFGAISLVTGTFLGLSRSIKNSLGDAIEFERQMVILSQVTGKSVKQLNDLYGEVTRLATGFGVSSDSLLKTSIILAQAGLEARKTKGALEVLAKTQLAASFDDIASTTEGAIAILAQFKREAASAGGDIAFLEKSLEAINQVSKKYAVESSDLVAVIRRSGGAFEAAGGSLNELLALFTSVRATTRESAETISTGLRTIFTRIQRVDTIKQLKDLGIELQDLQGRFVGPYEAIKRISEGLSSIDPRDFRFAQIVEELGGFRQISKVIPLIKQFGLAQEALNTAQSASGSLTQDAATAQQSLANQLTKVNEEFQALIRKFSDSEAFHSIAGGALEFARALIRIADAIEPLLPMIGALAAVNVGRGFVSAISAFTGFGGMGRQRRNGGGKIYGFATGGMVPGSGNGDTVPAMLSPGEFVIRKASVKKFGAQNLARLNSGGIVPTQEFTSGASTAQGATTLRKKIAQNKNWQPQDELFINYNIEEIDPLKTTDKLLKEQYLKYKINGDNRAGATFEQIVGKRVGKTVIGGNDFLDFPYGEAKSDKNWNNPLSSAKYKSLLAKTFNSFSSYNKKFTPEKDKVIATNKAISLYIDKWRTPASKENFRKQFPELVKKYATGGIVGGIADQNEVGALILQPQKKIPPKDKSISVTYDDIKGKDKYGKFTNTAFNQSYTLHKSGLSDSANGSYFKDLDRGINQGIKSAVNITTKKIASALGIENAEITQNSKDFAKYVNKGTRGTIFEEVIAQLSRSGGGERFDDRADSQAPFDFIGSIGEKTGQLFANKKALDAKYKDAKASNPAASPYNFKSKIARQLIKENTASLPTNQDILAKIKKAQKENTTPGFENAVSKKKLAEILGVSNTVKHEKIKELLLSNGITNFRSKVKGEDKAGQPTGYVYRFNSGGEVDRMEKNARYSFTRANLAKRKAIGFDKANQMLEKVSGDKSLSDLSKTYLKNVKFKEQIEQNAGDVGTFSSTDLQDPNNKNSIIYLNSKKASRATARHEIGHGVDLSLAFSDKFKNKNLSPDEISTAMDRFNKSPLTEPASHQPGTFQNELTRMLDEQLMRDFKRQKKKKSILDLGWSELDELQYRRKPSEMFADMFSKASPEVRSILMSTTSSKQGFQKLAEYLQKNNNKPIRGLGKLSLSDFADKYASGGVARSDTVPALLTPGEFVVNKKTAQKVGYGKLHRLNKTGDVQGYAKGGVVGGVQRFVNGGEAKTFVPGDPNDLAKMIAELESIDKTLQKITNAEISPIKQNATDKGKITTKDADALAKVLGTSREEIEKQIKIDKESLDIKKKKNKIDIEAVRAVSQSAQSFIFLAGMTSSLATQFAGLDSSTAKAATETIAFGSTLIGVAGTVFDLGASLVKTFSSTAEVAASAGLSTAKVQETTSTIANTAATEAQTVAILTNAKAQQGGVGTLLTSFGKAGVAGLAIVAVLALVGGAFYFMKARSKALADELSDSAKRLRDDIESGKKSASERQKYIDTEIAAAKNLADSYWLVTDAKDKEVAAAKEAAESLIDVVISASKLDKRLQEIDIDKGLSATEKIDQKLKALADNAAISANALSKAQKERGVIAETRGKDIGQLTKSDFRTQGDLKNFEALSIVVEKSTEELNKFNNQVRGLLQANLEGVLLKTDFSKMGPNSDPYKEVLVQNKAFAESLKLNTDLIMAHAKTMAEAQRAVGDYVGAFETEKGAKNQIAAMEESNRLQSIAAAKSAASATAFAKAMQDSQKLSYVISRLGDLFADIGSKLDQFGSRLDYINSVINNQFANFEIPPIKGLEDISKVINIGQFKTDINTIAQTLGQDGQDMADQIVAVASVFKASNSILNKNFGLLSSSDAETDRTAGSQAAAVIDDLLKPLKNKKFAALGSLVDRARQELLDAASGGSESGAFITAAEREKALGPIKEFTSQYSDLLKEINDKESAALDKYQKYSDALFATYQKEIDFREKAIDIQQKGAERFAEATGKSLTTKDKEAFRTAKTDTRLQSVGIFNSAKNVQGLGATLRDVNDELFKAKKDLEARGGKATPADIEKNKKLTLKAQEATSALEKLADQSDLAADVLNDIGKERAKREAATKVVEDFVTGGLEERANLTNTFTGIQMAAQSGTLQNFAPEMRKSITGMLDQLAAGDEQSQFAQLKKNLIFNDAVSMGLDPQTAQLLANATPIEQKLQQDLINITRQEQEALDELAKNTKQNKDVLEANTTELRKLNDIIAKESQDRIAAAKTEFDAKQKQKDKEAEVFAAKDAVAGAKATVEEKNIKIKEAQEEGGGLGDKLKDANQKLEDLKKELAVLNEVKKIAPESVLLTEIKEAEREIKNQKALVDRLEQENNQTNINKIKALEAEKNAAEQDLINKTEIYDKAIKETGFNPDQAAAVSKNTTAISELKTSVDALKGVLSENKGTPQTAARGGIIYRASGGSTLMKPKGTDTVPAMLTPGEFVVNAQSAGKYRSVLNKINNSRGGPIYLKNGGSAKKKKEDSFYDQMVNEYNNEYNIRGPIHADELERRKKITGHAAASLPLENLSIFDNSQPQPQNESSILSFTPPTPLTRREKDQQTTNNLVKNQNRSRALPSSNFYNYNEDPSEDPFNETYVSPAIEARIEDNRRFESMGKANEEKAAQAAQKREYYYYDEKGKIRGDEKSGIRTAKNVIESERVQKDLEDFQQKQRQKNNPLEIQGMGTTASDPLSSGYATERQKQFDRLQARLKAISDQGTFDTDTERQKRKAMDVSAAPMASPPVAAPKTPPVTEKPKNFANISGGISKEEKAKRQEALARQREDKKEDVKAYYDRQKEEKEQRVQEYYSANPTPGRPRKTTPLDEQRSQNKQQYNAQMSARREAFNQGRNLPAEERQKIIQQNAIRDRQQLMMEEGYSVPRQLQNYAQPQGNPFNNPSSFQTPVFDNGAQQGAPQAGMGAGAGAGFIAMDQSSQDILQNFPAAFGVFVDRIEKVGNHLNGLTVNHALNISGDLTINTTAVATELAKALGPSIEQKVLAILEAKENATKTA